jgi:hypothetical protein
MLDRLAPGHEPIDGYKLAQLTAPAIGPSGELVDTSVEDPSAPANRIQGQATGEEPSPPVEQLLKPEAPEQKPDMELAPLRVGPDGRPLPQSGEMVVDPLVVPPSGGAQGGEMVLEPLAVPPAAGTAGSTTPAPAPGAVAQPGSAAVTATSGVEPGLTRAFRYGNLRIVLFAAPTDARAPAYDAIVIEAINPTSAAGAKKPPHPSAKPAAPAAAKPAPKAPAVPAGPPAAGH